MSVTGGGVKVGAEGIQAVRATVKVPGTCGELAQGTIEGTPFLVSCPVDLYSQVTVELATEIRGISAPADSIKAREALIKALRLLDREDLGGKIILESSLPRGKGMASSTADIAGTVFAAALALNTRISPRQVADLALSIEPTDGVLFPDIVLFDHRRGTLYESLGLCPPMEVLVLDFGGEVDTISFNCADHSAIRRKWEPYTSAALQMVKEGIARGRADLIGEGASISAKANQEVLYKPQLELVLRLAKEVGGLGVCIGHSGTVIGILLDPQRHRGMEVQGYVQRKLPDLHPPLADSVCRVIGGGYRDADPHAGGRSSPLPGDWPPLGRI